MSAVREVVEGQTVHCLSPESPGEMMGGPSGDLPLAFSWLSARCPVWVCFYQRKTHNLENICHFGYFFQLREKQI